MHRRRAVTAALIINRDRDEVLGRGEHAGRARAM
jgi:hypothetical protein